MTDTRFQSLKGRLVNLARNPLARGSLGVAVLLAGSVLFSFVTGVLLARLLGSAEYGIYAYAMAWVGLLVIPANLGLPSLLTREMAVYQANADWGLLRGLLLWSQKMVWWASSLLLVVALGAAWLISRQEQHTLIALSIVLTSLPFAALVRLQQSSLRGLHYVIYSQVPDLLVRPLLLIAATLLCFFLTRGHFSVLWVSGLYTLTTVLVCLFSFFLLRTRLPKAMMSAAPRYTTNVWLRSAFPFLIISGLYVVTVQMDTLMIGTLRGTQEAGIYAVASQGAGLIRLALMAVHITVAPMIAKLYAEKKFGDLQQLLRKGSRALFLLSLPLALALIFLGPWVLHIFGKDFTLGQNVLIILTLGHLLNTAIGLAPLLLSMTEHEQSTAIGIGVGALLNIVLNLLLIPVLGNTGAAIASTTGLIVQNVLLTGLAWRRLKLNPTLF
jgi:O-antigen/teichoic acid export membrane protein